MSLKLPASLLKTVKALEIKTRQVVQSTFTGAYHAAFKGQGLSFAEVRAYVPGDDVRFIHWPMTAKLGETYVKVFEETRELTVILMVDVSASGRFGSTDATKRSVMAEVAAILGFSALNNQDRVGLLLFSEDVEHYIPPKKGRTHMFRLLRDIFYFKPQKRGTNVRAALQYLQQIERRKAIVFLMSDFLDEGYESVFRIAAKRHDLVPIVVTDPREQSLPAAGFFELEDMETGDVVMVNAGDRSVREKFSNIVLAKKTTRDRLFAQSGVVPILLSVGDDLLMPLRRFFQGRS